MQSIGKKLTAILNRDEVVLTLENGKERFQKDVAIFKTTIEAEVNVAEISLFQAEKARFTKFTSANNRKSDEEIRIVICPIIIKQ